MILHPTTTTRRTRGSALLTTMILTGILTVSLAGYIAVVSQQNKLSARTQGWNLAVAVAEAGLEEGLQHLNANSTSLAVDGWSYDGTSYTITRSFADGNGYKVNITNSATPSVVSRAYINNFTFASDAVSSGGTVGGNVNRIRTIVRAVQVTCSKGSLLKAPIAVQRSLDMNGNNVLTDSYDSSDIYSSSNGQYSASLAGSEGDIACNGALQNSVNIGNANIFGRVATGPGVTVDIGRNGSIGSQDWQVANGGRGIQDGWVTDDSNFTFPDTSLPYRSGLPLAGGDVVTSSVSVSSASASSSTYPSPAPSGNVVTNTSSTTTSIYPSPVPRGLTTNTSYQTVSTLPSPIRAGTTTNTSSTTSTTYPSSGTYVGAVTSSTTSGNGNSGNGNSGNGNSGNGNGNSGNGNSTRTTYSYNRITGYTYPVYTYSYPTYSYVYSVATTNTVYTTNHYDNILSSGDYLASTLRGSTLITGRARLVLTDGFEMGSRDTITMGERGSIEMYVDGDKMEIKGQGLVNQASKPADFMVYCTPNVSEVKFTGNGSFVGVIVAPNAEMTLNGGGRDGQDFCGAAMVDSLKMNGHFKFHYDKALGSIGGNGRFLITSWNEIQ